MSTNAIAIQSDPFLAALDDPSRELQLRGYIADMVAFAQDLIVDTEAAYASITALYAQARQWRKSIDQQREELVRPFRAQISRINDRAKTLFDPLDAVIDAANVKANGYVKMVEARKREADTALRAQAALFDAQDELYIAPMEKNIRGDGAIAVTKIEKRFRVTDMAQVPAKYLIVDEKAVKRDIQLGIGQIPGIEVYEEQITTLRTR